MKRKSAVTAIVLFLFVAATAGAADVVRTEKQTFPAAALKALSLESNVGNLRVEASDTTEIQVEWSVRCGDSAAKCKEKADAIRLDSGTANGELHLKVQGFPRVNTKSFSVDITVRIPKSMALSAELGVGDVALSGLERDVKIHVGVGDVTIRGRADAFKSVDLEAGVGDADLRVPGGAPKSHGFIGTDLTWSEGKGTATIAVEAGVGDARVVLD